MDPNFDTQYIPERISQKVDFEKNQQMTKNHAKLPVCKELKLSLPITTTVLPAKSDSDFMLCLQSYQGLIIDRSIDSC